MIITVADGAVNLGYSGTQRPLVQNLGPGILYISSSANDLATEGIEIAPDAAYELPATLNEGAQQLYALAVGDDCDVRTLNVG